MPIKRKGSSEERAPKEIYIRELKSCRHANVLKSVAKENSSTIFGSPISPYTLNRTLVLPCFQAILTRIPDHGDS